LTNDLFFSLLFRNFDGCGTIACHKLDPAGGVGATSAMHDALCLANWINVLPSLDERTVENTFQEYYLERYRVALQFYKDSLRLGTANKKVPNQAVKKKVGVRSSNSLLSDHHSYFSLLSSFLYTELQRGPRSTCSKKNTRLALYFVFEEVCPATTSSLILAAV